MQNYFAAESSIIARLKTVVTELKTVEGQADVSEKQLRQGPKPLAVVVHHGFSPADDNGGSKTKIIQRWSIELIIEAPNDMSGSRARAEAGPLIPKIITALCGWSPIQGSALAMLKLGAAPPEEYVDGVAIFHLRFNMATVL